MIVRSIFTTLILLSGYWLFIANSDNKEISSGQHQWQENVIKAQQYLYSDIVADKVIIGSSLSCRLTSSVLDSQGFYNLSFGGQSVYDGLEILCHNKVFPKKLFVEINMLKRNPDETFTRGLTHAILFPIRQRITPFREAYQPANYLNGCIPAIGEKAIDRFTNSFFNPILNKFHAAKATTGSATTDGSVFFKSLVKRQELAFNEAVDTIQFNVHIMWLQKKFEYLQSKGVKIIFFEMPLHYTLQSSKQMNFIRSALTNTFPADKYTYLTAPEYAEYTTTDGLHLNPESALKYTENLIQQNP